MAIDKRYTKTKPPSNNNKKQAHTQDGRVFVRAQPGETFLIKITNRSSTVCLATALVDGKRVLLKDAQSLPLYRDKPRKLEGWVDQDAENDPLRLVWINHH